MWQKLFMLICLCGYCAAGPLATSYQKRNMPIVPRENTQEQLPAEEESAPEATPAADLGTLTLPSNATSIRGDITDTFSCENRTYGYYADVENDCQIFHVCLPVTYADGKENIFRWSFICPEETIFSQESFTCMRREDMTTSCEESFKYYDLNRNFGSSEDESNKNTNTNNNNNNHRHQPTNRRPEPTPIESEVEAEKVQEVVKPVAEPEPTVVKPQTIKAPKPNRRKPASSYNNQKKDSVPLRKIPQTTPHSVPVEEKPIINVSIVTEQEENKPVPQRINKKPASTITQSIKEKPQVNKAETAPIRIELYNQKRKRPSFMNKKDAAATTPKPVEQDNNKIQAQVDLKEPEPTLHLESMFVAPTESKKTTESEVTLDSDAEPSESVVSISSPEQPVKVIENEEQPVQIETVKEDFVANNQEVTEPILASIGTIEDEKTPEVPLVAYEEIPAVIVEAEETKPEEDVPQPPKIEESNVLIETAEDQQATSVVPSIAESETSEANIKILENIPEVPAIVEPIQSSETQSIEAMEAEKPADAPESLPAAPAIEQHSPMVEEVLDNKDDPHQTLGDFKPVDPEMAAEAEQLISDFLNALRKNEENVQKISEQSKPEISTAETEEESPKETEEEAKVASIAADESSKNDSIEEAKLPEETQPQIIDPNVSVEEQDANEQVANDPALLKNTASAPNVFLMNHLPPSMYQIPVKVIQGPEEGSVDTSEKQAIDTPKEDETAAASVQQPTIEEQPHVESEPSFMMPLNIDDIVEMVKEHLDQAPKDVQPMPMELVITNVNEENKPAELPVEVLVQVPAKAPAEIPIESPSETLSEAPKAELKVGTEEKQEAPKTEQENTDIVVPIFHRNENNILKTKSAATQTEMVAPAIEAVAAKVVEIKPKMDARKRRFLFRADA